VQALHHLGFKTISPIPRRAEELHSHFSLLLDFVNIIGASLKSESLSIVTVSVSGVECLSIRRRFHQNLNQNGKKMWGDVEDASFDSHLPY
jgi:hypothetical protein